MSLDVFLDSLGQVTTELNRNFTLITDLDKKTQDLMEQIRRLFKEYGNTKSKKHRRKISEEIANLFDTIDGYAGDKRDLAQITYSIVDKHIKQLNLLGNNEALTMPVDPNEPRFCVCRGVSFGDMIACDNPDCLIEWFHLPCVNLISAPKKWFCPQCDSQTKRPNGQRKRGKPLKVTMKLNHQ